MKSIEIRIALLHAGVTQAEIARKLDLHPSSITHVIEGRDASHRVREAIAEATGLDLAKLWPSVYLFGGPRKRGRPSQRTKEAA